MARRPQEMHGPRQSSAQRHKAVAVHVGPTSLGCMASGGETELIIRHALAFGDARERGGRCSATVVIVRQVNVDRPRILGLTMA